MKTLKIKHDMSKTLMCLFLIMVTSLFMEAQTAKGFGVKGGINYNSNGDYFNAIDNTYNDPSGSSGFHFGLFGKIGSNLYFRPELVYTSTKTNYNNESFKMQKIDAPMLVGINIIGPFSVFGGPSFQYIVDSEFSGISINDIEKNFTVGLNFGLGVNFNKLGIDLRYERGLSKNEATFVNKNITENSRIDTRPSQLILSLSFIL